MAKLPALVSALAECDGRDRATIDHIARVIREAGYIPTTKRGAGAAEMTAREAANLFIGANGCDALKDAPLAIDRFRSLVLHDAYTSPGVEVEAFKRVSEAGNFGIALEALIGGMGGVLEGAECFLRNGYKTRPDIAVSTYRDLLKRSWLGSLIPFHLDIQMWRYQAEIHCSVFVGSEDVAPHWRTEFRARFTEDYNRHEKGFYGAPTDRYVSVFVTGFTIFKLWSALQDKTIEGK